MKNPSVVSFLITLMLAAAVCTHGFREHVKDKDGNPVEINQQYFIQPVKTPSNNGGGLVPSPPKLFPLCPLGIAQAAIPTQPGLPVSFAFSHELMETTVPTSSDVTIEFKSSFWPFCNKFSKLWKVDDSSIIIGGKPEEKNSWFMIEEAKGAGANTYTLSTSTRRTIGAVPEGLFGAQQLVLTNDKAKTLVVKFKKVEDATTATTSRVEKLGLRMFPFY